MAALYVSVRLWTRRCDFQYDCIEIPVAEWQIVVLSLAGMTVRGGISHDGC
jgi:hypothetical protein